MADLVPVFLILGLIGIYLITYKLNKRTAIPKECIEDIDTSACNACHNFTCSHSGGVK